MLASVAISTASMYEHKNACQSLAIGWRHHQAMTIATGIAVGVGLGTVLGTAIFDNIGIGIAVGIVIGVAVSQFMHSRFR
ncbi:hypothetical protein QTA58_19885 [Neorhizobium sp. CSC1952]|uniref:hypothetical protein n=1 Tax=Neorhizobium sp. CSC1952 TaxID=2978974 RepID=UPI0025A4F566|nr:hypothetical protein [Rhizobium sp. CSC1952]WJR66449.1 hypothetical protein QTA58_19885 [Rhizobium sp. CSC1952]